MQMRGNAAVSAADASLGPSRFYVRRVSMFAVYKKLPEAPGRFTQLSRRLLVLLVGELSPRVLGCGGFVQFWNVFNS
jgi:hypothetical protein